MRFVTGLLVTSVLGWGGVALAQTPVRVATWNIQGVGDPGTAEYNAALAILQRVGADVVGFNEIAGTSDLPNFEALANAAGYPYFAIGDESSFGGLRNAFMSIYPIQLAVSETSAGLSGDPGADDITRVIMRVVVDVPPPAKDLTLVAHHWKSGTANEDEFRRATESIRVTQTVAGLDPLNDVYVLMGDINEEIESVPRPPNPFTSVPGTMPPSYQLGSDLQTEMITNGITNDPFHYLTRAGGPETVILDALQLDGVDGTRPASGRRIDYLFLSPSLFSGAQGEVYDSSDEGLPGGLTKAGPVPAAGDSLAASDHLMVFADVTVPVGSCSIDADCNNGLFCDGVEQCVGGTCQSGTDPCAGQSCNEIADQCVAGAVAWINELHYDNASTDTNEGVEIAGPAGLDLSGWRVVAYNGNGGSQYNTVNLSGTIPNQDNGYGTLWIPISGLQNGAPDAVALVDPFGAVVEFLSYEGVLTAADGPAAGQTSVDIGVQESNSDPAGQSLQRQGSGQTSNSFTWAGPLAHSRGLVNANQSFTVGCSNDSECDDGQFCNGVEICSAGICQSGPPVACDDGVACTDDFCDEAADACTASANNAACSDGLFCNGSEVCDLAAGCVAGAPPSCDDGVACTVDSCDNVAGCVNAPDDAVCDDGLFCTGTETCDAALGCQAGADPCGGGACDEGLNQCVAPPTAWINELHYDNASTDTNEGVEVAGPAGLNLSGWQIVAYNGNGGSAYNTVNLSGVIPDQDGGYGTLWFAISGLQNGAPDAVALVDDTGMVIELLSYEGTLVAVGGPADGLTSTDIGVAESNSDPAGLSLQRIGTGQATGAFTWTGPVGHSRGAVNAGQSFGGGGGGCTSDTECDDGLFCNGAETCNAGSCQAGVPVDCSSLDSVCESGVCDEVQDACVAQPVAAGTSCDDGDACTGGDQCDGAGACIGGGNICTGIVAEQMVLTSVSGWSSVALANSYTSPVIVCTPVYTEFDAPAVVRLDNVTGGGFDFTVQAANDGTLLGGVPVHCLAVEEGVYNQAAHGVDLEAVRYLSTVTDGRGSWNAEGRAYQNSYASPVVVGQVMSFNDTRFSVFWARGGSRSSPPSSSGLFVGKHVGEDGSRSRNDETVGYIVIEAGTGTLGNLSYEAGLGADTVRGAGNSPPFSYGLSGGGNPSAAVLSSAAMDGNDGAWPFLYGPNPVSASQLAMCVDEDQLRDTERSHTTEQVAYIVLQ